MVIYLDDYLKNNDIHFFNKKNGENLRKRLKLDVLEKQTNKIYFNFSNNIKNISLAFLVGIFEETMMKMSEKDFFEKYIFQIEKENEKILRTLEFFAIFVFKRIKRQTLKVNVNDKIFFYNKNNFKIVE